MAANGNELVIESVSWLLSTYVAIDGTASRPASMMDVKGSISVGSFDLSDYMSVTPTDVSVLETVTATSSTSSLTDDSIESGTLPTRSVERRL